MKMEPAFTRLQLHEFWHPPALEEAPLEEMPKLVTVSAQRACKHENQIEKSKNRFECPDCQMQWRKVSQKVLKRALFLRSARSLHRGK